MDLKQYTVQEMFQAAIGSEHESNRIYADLAHRVKNVFLKEKLRYLAGEEEKHAAHLTREFASRFKNKEMVIPEKSPVPLPGILIPDEGVPLSEIIDSAMRAEKAAQDFYLSMKEHFDPGDPILRTLDLFAAMEGSHHVLLSVERENLAQFEEYDTYWDMMNMGP